MMFQKETLKKHLPFLCILLVAIFLRLFRIQDFQFDSDELSAIFRAQKALCWNEHIQNGVLIDGHPAGLQTLLWLWIQVFSFSLLPLKWIAASFGIFNVVLIYAITRKLFSENSALFATICAAGLWWQVDLSLWVRPYVFGQFFTIATLYLIQLNNPSKLSNHWTLLSFSMAGAFYMHHFAFLSSILVVFVSIVTQPQKRKSIFKSLLFLVVLSIPQIQIVLTQLKTGGLDWLGKPQLTFIWKHLYSIFNHSRFNCLFILLGSILGIYSSVKFKKYSNYRISGLLLFLWVMPIVIGYAYSIFFKPVLQNNVLFFSFPFLIIGISRFVSDIKRPLALIFFSLFLGLVSIQLWTKKKRFNVEIKDVYHTQIQFLSSHSNDESLTDGPPDVFEFHRKNLNFKDSDFNAPNIWNLSQKPFDVSTLVTKMMSLKRKSQFNLLTNSGTNPMIRPMVHYYLNQYKVDYFIGGQIDQFEIPQNFDTSIFKSNHVGTSSLLQPIKSIVLDTSACFYFNIGETVKPNDLLLFVLDKPNHQNELSMVTAMIQPKSKTLFIPKEEEQIDWRSSSCHNYWSAGMNKAFHVLKLSDIPKWNKNTRVRIGIEGKIEKNEKFRIEIYRFSGNPYQYGID